MCHTTSGSCILTWLLRAVGGGQADVPCQVAKRLRDGPVTIPRSVLVDQRGTRPGMPEPGHQLLETRAARGGEGAARVSEIVEMQVRDSGPLTRPDPYPPEFGPPGKAAPAAPLARRQRRAQLLGEARPAHAGPHRAGPADQAGSYGTQRGCGSAVFLGDLLSAPGRRVEVAPCGRVACDRFRRTSTRRPLARDRRLSRKMGENQAGGMGAYPVPHGTGI